MQEPVHPLEQGLSRGVWKNQTVPHEPSYAYATGARETAHLVHNSFFNRVHAGAA